MSAKNFRFRSPGIRIEEIDESIFTLPPLSEVGPVIVGRSAHGPSLKPVKVASVDEFTNIFGVPSPGGFASTDLWRGVNTSAPDYGSYAALAYLRNSAPVTYIRLAGTEHPNKTATTTTEYGGAAGWQTTCLTPNSTLLGSNGGAYGLFLFPSSSGGNMGTGSLAAVFYMNSGSAVLTHNGQDPGTYVSKQLCQFTGSLVNADIKLRISSSVMPTGYGYTTSSVGGYRDVSVKMDPGAGNFIRKAFNTSAILTNTADNGVDNPEYMWLGETFEDYILKKDTDFGTVTNTMAFITPMTNIAGAIEKANYRFPFQAARTGYVFAQDDGASGSFDPISNSPQKLFRIVGLTEGDWASRNIKISISNISYTPIDGNADPYGTFNVSVRAVQDSDDNPVLLETFDSVNLNPRSPDFIGRRIGDQYLVWDTANDKIELFGDYPNQSRYIRVEVDTKVKLGGADSNCVPFGFMGPARRQKFQVISGSTAGTMATGYSDFDSSYAYNAASFGVSRYPLPGNWLENMESDVGGIFTASLDFPDYQLRVTASNATRGVSRNAYFGVRTSRTDAGRYFSPAYYDLTIPLEAGVNSWVASAGTTVHTFAFSLDDVRQASSSADGWSDNAIYTKNARQSAVPGTASISALGTYYKASQGNGTSTSRYTNTDGWKTVLDAGYKAFTMPMHGGFDGVNIKEKNPFSTSNVAGGATTDGRSNYAWYSVLTAIKMLRDPEFLDFNLASVPGMIDSTLNTKLADYCENRGDALALLDVDSGYRPLEDIKASQLTSNTYRGTVTDAVDYRRNSLSSVIHSYAAAFYPWVDISDGRTNSVVACPPTVAMMGVFGRVKQTSEVWFAPAGFQRGGLSDGSTGLRVLNVKDRLTSAERDELYDAGINPIANFPAEGIVVFGQKTLQLQRSALDRINVRRLMIYLKRKIGGIASRTLFEQNVRATWKNFTKQAVSVLDAVKDGLGIVDYKFILDETTTTPDLIDQNVLYAKLYIKPARAIEYIALDFIITKTGAQFPE